ncbi:hypothetical protein [Mucilaginibacter pedocola]|nr:hypothetical protein [Mucilaginibacter pedocola]
MKKYKRLPQHPPEQLKRLQEIGELKSCPLEKQKPNGESEGQLTDFVIWLRLQHYRLEYRLLYYDMAVCCAYILFMFSALKLTAVVPQTWFAVITVLVLCLCCVLFIAVHLMPNTRADKNLKPGAWGNYCSTLKYGTGAYRVYLIVLMLTCLLYWHNERNLDGQLIVWIMPLAAIHFTAGLKMLKSNLQAKLTTEEYLRLAGKSRV